MRMHSVLVEIPRFHLGPVPVGPLAIHAYGAMLALGFMLGLFGVLVLAMRLRTINPERVTDLALIILVSGVVGARLLYVLLNYRAEFAANPVEMLYIQRGGLAFHGGVVGALLAGLIYTTRLRLSFGAVADTIAPFAALGYATTKIGCFLNGCCHGRPSDVPWACQFPVYPGDLNRLTPPSHPAQLYDTLLNLGVFAIVLWIALRRRRWNGYAFTWWLLLYSITRIVTDYFRYCREAPIYSTAEAIPGLGDLPVVGGITEAQVTSVAVILAASAVLWACRRCTLETRVDVRVLPAFALGAWPAMAALFLWLTLRPTVLAAPPPTESLPTGPELAADSGSSGALLAGAVYTAITVAVAALAPAICRRVAPARPTPAETRSSAGEPGPQASEDKSDET